MSIGQYEYANELFKYIIDKGFTSREIFNNLGLCFVYQALELNLEDKYFKLLIPFKLDLSTRLESHETTRSVSIIQEAVILLNKAKREFEKAIQLDENYSISKENLFFTEIALKYLGETVRSQINLNDIVSSEQCCEFCVKGHSYYSNNEHKKAQKQFKKGSPTCDICNINIDFIKNQTPQTQKYQKTVFDLEEVNGVDMYCKDFDREDCNIYYKLLSSKICIKNFPGLKLFMLKNKVNRKTSCISIQEININDEKLKNNIDVYIGDNINKILETYPNIRILNASNSMYIYFEDEQLTFLIKDGKVHKWYYFETLN